MESDGRRVGTGTLFTRCPWSPSFSNLSFELITPTVSFVLLNFPFQHKRFLLCEYIFITFCCAFSSLYRVLTVYLFRFHIVLLLAENRNPKPVFVLVWWKQLLTAGGLVLTTLLAVSLGYLIDWAVFGLPEDDENTHCQVSHERESTDGENDGEMRPKTD